MKTKTVPLINSFVRGYQTALERSKGSLEGSKVINIDKYQVFNLLLNCLLSSFPNSV